MAILSLQQRQRELGRIRLGHKVGAKGRPEKLDKFRFTSASKPLIESIAFLYGGTVQPWDGAGTPQWEVITETQRVAILVPPQPVSQFMELWSGGGCQRRCDGVTELLTDQPCMCDPDPEKQVCKPTTRLNVMLRDVHGVGVWRLESHGWNTATELPQTAAFLAQATAAGQYIPAQLALEERTSKKDGQTKRFVVPTIEVDVTPAQLMSGQGGAMSIGDGERPTIGGAGPAAIEAAADDRDWDALIAGATTVAETRALWNQAIEAGIRDETLGAKIQARADEITAAGSTTAEPASTDIDTLWQQIVAQCPVGWTLDDLELRFSEANDGTMPGAAEPEQLQKFLAELRGVAVGAV